MTWGRRFTLDDLNKLPADRIKVDKALHDKVSLPATEDDLQIQCISAFKAAYPQYFRRIWHPANGGHRNPREAKRFKDMGVLPGVCDIIISIPRGTWHGMFAELKLGSNDLSGKQEEFIKEHERDYYCVVCWTVHEFMTEVNKYLSIEPEQYG